MQTDGGHDVLVRGYLVAAVIGAVAGCAFMVFADALTPQSDGGCIESQVPCPSPPLFTWSEVRPGWALVGAGVGAVLGVLVHVLTLREQRRRDRVGV